ncbi:DNA alkylation repair enzyme [Kipferlia bialata]|uniref:DNA alkylation repair enzyme n=1 Tax=Kipferlia bialata TaxID=797122 RepID=A0A9K3GMU3_9EUKA|nr:DNA alkylation repair enzyme [Kipferlia bialata]|eukprot:g11058.t1
MLSTLKPTRRPGEYGEGDTFIGVRIPKIRQIVKDHRGTDVDTAVLLVRGEVHEERTLGLLLLVDLFERSVKRDKETALSVFNAYMAHTQHINNWDLVDTTAPKIVGRWLLEGGGVGVREWIDSQGPQVKTEVKVEVKTEPGRRRPKRSRAVSLEIEDAGTPGDADYIETFMVILARSPDLWERRIAMVCNLHLIRQRVFSYTLTIARMLLTDGHDLIHKAVGWMLREVGNRDLETEEEFLREHYRTMPRTMLRYAIEKFEEGKRQDYLKGRI